MFEPGSRSNWDPFHRLGLAIFIQAVRDVHAGGLEGKAARTWLLENGAHWLDALGVDYPVNFETWVTVGCSTKDPLRRPNEKHIRELKPFPNPLLYPIQKRTNP